MEIIEINQVRHGEQSRPYANHVWQWEIKLNNWRGVKEGEVLEFAQKFLKSCKYDRDTYFKLYRDNQRSFDEHMLVVCEGYFELKNTEYGNWTYKVEQEYID